MSTITILGAGVMGSSMTLPLRDRGHAVRLVGTHLDRDIIDSVKSSGRHPKLNIALPRPVRAPGAAAPWIRPPFGFGWMLFVVGLAAVESWQRVARRELLQLDWVQLLDEPLVFARLGRQRLVDVIVAGWRRWSVRLGRFGGIRVARTGPARQCRQVVLVLRRSFTFSGVPSAARITSVVIDLL